MEKRGMLFRFFDGTKYLDKNLKNRIFLKNGVFYEKNTRGKIVSLLNSPINASNKIKIALP